MWGLGRARTCDGIVRMLTSEFKRLVNDGETTAASGRMVTDVIDHCIGIKAGGTEQQALLSSLIDAGTAEFVAMVSRAQDGEAVSLSSEELEQIRDRLERRTAHLARWREERQRLLQ